MPSAIVTKPANNFKDLTGKRFGPLTVIEYTGIRYRMTMWRCRCDCGREVIANRQGLRDRRSPECRCARSFSERSASHRTKTPAYKSWSSMRSRCLNPAHHKFHLYGGRGISICKPWNAFDSFLADMGPRPEGTTLDRVDSNGNYEPGNCRWATPIEQAKNRRKAKERRPNDKPKTDPQHVEHPQSPRDPGVVAQV
jgi:hypothetical protein